MYVPHQKFCIIWLTVTPVAVLRFNKFLPDRLVLSFRFFGHPAGPLQAPPKLPRVHGSSERQYWLSLTTGQKKNVLHKQVIRLCLQWVQYAFHEELFLD
jgi:hypothetical protein